MAERFPGKPEFFHFRARVAELLVQALQPGFEFGQAGFGGEGLEPDSEDLHGPGEGEFQGLVEIGSDQGSGLLQTCAKGAGRKVKDQLPATIGDNKLAFRGQRRFEEPCTLHPRVRSGGGSIWR